MLLALTIHAFLTVQLSRSLISASSYGCVLNLMSRTGKQESGQFLISGKIQQQRNPFHSQNAGRISRHQGKESPLLLLRTGNQADPTGFLAASKQHHLPPAQRFVSSPCNTAHFLNCNFRRNHTLSDYLPFKMPDVSVDLSKFISPHVMNLTPSAMKVKRTVKLVTKQEVM